MTFYQVWTEVRRIRREFGRKGSHESYKTLKYLASFWAANPWVHK